MKRWVLAAVIAAFAVTNALAQDIPKPSPPEKPAGGAASMVPLNVQLVLSRYQGEKKISSMPYMLGVLTNAQKTSLRVGTQVPVVTTVFGPKSEGTPAQSYTYRDVGTNIDCSAQSLGSGQFSLNITVEDSSIQLDRSQGAGDQKQALRDVPAFRSFRVAFATVLRDGQTMQFASATDPVSGEVLRVDVTLALAK
jgi:hypothetical protein